MYGRQTVECSWSCSNCVWVMILLMGRCIWYRQALQHGLLMRLLCCEVHGSSSDLACSEPVTTRVLNLLNTAASHGAGLQGEWQLRDQKRQLAIVRCSPSANPMLWVEFSASHEMEKEVAKSFYGTWYFLSEQSNYLARWDNSSTFFRVRPRLSRLSLHSRRVVFSCTAGLSPALRMTIRGRSICCLLLFRSSADVRGRFLHMPSGSFGCAFASTRWSYPTPRDNLHSTFPIATAWRSTCPSTPRCRSDVIPCPMVKTVGGPVVSSAPA